jgi:hypothetical protein
VSHSCCLWSYCILILFEAVVPTVGDAIEALTNLCDELLETLKQMTVVSAELDARDHVQVDDIRQVSHYIIPIELNNIPGPRHRLFPYTILIRWVTLTSVKNAL